MIWWGVWIYIGAQAILFALDAFWPIQTCCERHKINCNQGDECPLRKAKK